MLLLNCRTGEPLITWCCKNVDKVKLVLTSTQLHKAAWIQKFIYTQPASKHESETNIKLKTNMPWQYFITYCGWQTDGGNCKIALSALPDCFVRFGLSDRIYLGDNESSCFLSDATTEWFVLEKLWVKVHNAVFQFKWDDYSWSTVNDYFYDQFTCGTSQALVTYHIPLSHL